MKFRLAASAFAFGASFAIQHSLPAAAATQFVGRPAPTQAVDLFVKLPLRNAAELEDLTRVQSDPLSPEYHRFLTVAQFRARYAPSTASVQQAVAALRASGLHVQGVQSQLIVVAAPVAAVEHALGVTIGVARTPEGKTRLAAEAAPKLPRGLVALHASVIGLKAMMAPRSFLRPAAKLVPQNRYSAEGPYWFTDLKQAYSYPAYTAFNGKGVTIAVVGESDFSDSDATLYFNHERLGGTTALAPAPTLEHLQLGGAPFNPSPSAGASQEANVDVQFSGGSAPGATIVGVDVPSVGEGFLYGYSVIVDENSADIVSTSYGECELFYTSLYPEFNYGGDSIAELKAYHEMFLQGNAQGITFLFSSGDDSGKPCPEPAYLFSAPTGTVYKDLPGTSIWSRDPNVTRVGGTNLITSVASDKLTSSYVRESAYDDKVAPVDLDETGNLIGNASWGSGGGPSVIFPKPWYQKLVNTGPSTMRTDPDVSMQMGGCPAYPVKVYCGADDSAGIAAFGGSFYGFIGTSLSSPEFAGLLAVYEQSQGNVRMGNANGYIYRLAQTNSLGGYKVFHQGIPGCNSVIDCTIAGKPGYNQIVGVGTPISSSFVGLPLGPKAGNPQTTKNP